MRAQRKGVIANMGSVGGWEGTAACGLYSAAKFAMAGISQSLGAEVAHLGIQVVLIEPGYFCTSCLSPGHKITTARMIPDLSLAWIA